MLVELPYKEFQLVPLVPRQFSNAAFHILHWYVGPYLSSEREFFGAVYTSIDNLLLGQFKHL